MMWSAMRPPVTWSSVVAIVESSAGVFLENRTEWMDKFRTVAGVRSDYYHFDVRSNNPANSGTTWLTRTCVNPTKTRRPQSGQS